MWAPRIWGEEALGSLDSPPHLWEPTDVGQAVSLAGEGGMETVLSPCGHLHMHAQKIILRIKYLNSRVGLVKFCMPIFDLILEIPNFSERNVRHV